MGINNDCEPLGHVQTRLTKTMDVIPFINRAMAARSVRATQMNEKTDDCGGSSRSHCALILTLFQVVDGKYVKTTFTLVDFAGAERPDKAGTDRYSGTEVLMDMWFGKPIATGAQAFVINYELFELGTAVVKATDSHLSNAKYAPPTQLVSPFLKFVASCMDGSSLLGVVVTVSQARRCGWETWFTMKYGTDLANLKVPVNNGRTIVNFYKVVEKTKRDLREAEEALEKTPKEGTPASKYWEQRDYRVKELKALTLFLTELAVEG